MKRLLPLGILLCLSFPAVAQVAPYHLIPATASKLGGVKPGFGLAVASDGTLSYTYITSIGAGLNLSGGVLSVVPSGVITGVTATGLSAGASPTASFSGGVLSLGIPAGAAGAQGIQGVQGVAGANGSNGTNGSNGAAATIAAGTATGLSAGASPTVTNAGTSSAAVFNFGIPAGATGSAGATGAAGTGYTLGTASQTAHMNAGATAFVTDSALLNNGNQVAVGGSIDTGSRLSVSPQGASENGLSVSMPAGSINNAVQIKNTTGVATYIDNGGRLYVNPGFLSIANNVDSSCVITSHNVSTPALLLYGTNGQTQNLFQINDYTGAQKFAIGPNGSVNFGAGNIALSGNLTISGSGSFMVGTNSGSSGYSLIDSAGRLWVNPSGTTGWDGSVFDAAAGIISRYASLPVLVVGGVALQSGDMQQWVNNSRTVLSRISNGGAMTLSGYANATALATPGQPTLTTVGTAGSTTYAYRVAAQSGTGITLASVERTITTGNATLSTSNYNVITLPVVAGAESYLIFGRLPGAEQLLASGVTAATWNDTGAVTPSGALPTANTTGYVNAAGGFQAGGTSGYTGTIPLNATGLKVVGGLTVGYYTGGTTSAPTTPYVGN